MSREIETLIKSLESRQAELREKAADLIKTQEYTYASDLRLISEGIAEALEIVRKWVD